MQKTLMMKQDFLIAWNPPPTGCIKINVDASTLTNPGQTAIGGLARNAEGSWSFGFAKRLGWGNITRAELFAIYYGLLLAWDRGFRDVFIESDSLLAVSKVNGDLRPTDQFYQIVRACKDLLSRTWRCRVVHTYREANMCADYLASWAHGGNVDITHLDHPPGQLHHFLQEDLLGVARPRAVPV